MFAAISVQPKACAARTRWFPATTNRVLAWTTMGFCCPKRRRLAATASTSPTRGLRGCVSMLDSGTMSSRSDGAIRSTA
jgi:hypothetical protein